MGIQNWANSRETSLSIARVILAISSDAEEAERIWANPTKEEFYLIRDAAFLVDIDESSLCWGGIIQRDSKYTN